MTFDLKRAKELCEAATAGPWQWFGNTKMREVYLATIDRGRVFVMDFVRWGMSSAQPRFQLRDQHLGDHADDCHLDRCRRCQPDPDRWRDTRRGIQAARDRVGTARAGLRRSVVALV
jgi:hypothetical protein